MSLHIQDRRSLTRSILETRDDRPIMSRHGSHRSAERIRAIILHQTSFESCDDHRLDYVIANYVVRQDGVVDWVRGDEDLLNDIHSGAAINIEFVGDYPNIRCLQELRRMERSDPDDLHPRRRHALRHRDRNWISHSRHYNYPPTAQINAGRELLQHLKRRIPNINQIFAHAQFTRKNCPGPHLWYNVGQWGISNLGLRDIGLGANHIPTDWLEDHLDLMHGI